jgi:hypothetical protein
VTIIDADTGEIVSSTALERPRLAEPGQPIALAQLIPQCRSIEVWAERTESVAEVKDAAHKLDAIGRYIAATSKDGCAVVAATQRRLEARIGVLLGKASRGGDRKSDQVNRDSFDPALSPQERSQFRKMADHPDIVEAVIDDSDDETPASRRRVLDEINKARALKAQAEQDADEFKAMQPDGFDPALNKELIRQRGELTRLCQHLVDLGDPAEFLDRHDGHLRDSHIAAVLNAADHLARFADEIKERGLG